MDVQELSQHESSIDSFNFLAVCVNVYTSRNSLQAKQIAKTIPMLIASFNAFVALQEIVKRLKNNYYPDGRLLVRLQKSGELVEAESVSARYIVFDNDEIEVVLGEEGGRTRREVEEELTETELIAGQNAKGKTTRKVVRRNPTIRVMQESVRRWRDLKEKKYSYRTAAKIVGIPKKDFRRLLHSH